MIITQLQKNPTYVSASSFYMFIYDIRMFIYNAVHRMNFGLNFC